MTLAQNIKKRRYWILAALLIVLVAFGIVQTVKATHDITLNCSPSNIPANSVTPVTCPGPKVVVGKGDTTFEQCGFHGTLTTDVAVYSISIEFGTDGDEQFEGPLTVFIEAEGQGNVHFNLLPLFCSDASYDPFAPGIWLMALCEPLDGFSPDDWISVDTDALNGALPPTLYVAAGPDGPWHATEFLFPPYIMSKAQVEGLTAWMGLSDYHDLWLKPSEAGTPANLGSMIEDREANMDALCGTDALTQGGTD